jgi:Protein of unknown function (DUF1302)
MHPQRRKTIGTPPTRLIALMGMAMGSSLVHSTSSATEFELNGMKGSFNAEVTLGTQVRASSSDTFLVNNNNSQTIGMPGNPFGSSARNNDDGNLNFKKGDTTSTLARVMFDVSLKGATTDIVVKGKAWYDFIQANHGMPYGNTLNGYIPGSQLGESGANSLAKSSGIQLMETFVKTKFALGSTNADLSLGNQKLAGWGEQFMLGGGLKSVTPTDLAAAFRPGVDRSEIGIAMPMVKLGLGLGTLGTVDAYYQIGSRQNVLPHCGTFFALPDFLATGCNKVYLGPGTDVSRDAAGQYLTRSADQKYANSDQYGLAYRFKVDSLNTAFSLNYSVYNMRDAITSAIKSSNAVTPVINGNAAGTNTQYFLEYPEHVSVAGLSFTSTLGKFTRVSGELSRTGNQAIGLNGPDILNAFANYAAPTPLRSAEQATGLGQAFHGYDRFSVNQLKLSASHVVANVLGANDLTMYGELGLRHVVNLPDVNVKRYGRGVIFGQGPVGGVCQGGSTPGSAQCQNEGFVTQNAWGLRTRFAARYLNVFSNTDLIPSLVLGKDVKGYSDDGTFSEGRKPISLSLKAVMQKKYWLEFTVQSFRGGNYNPLRDHNYYSIVAGASL